MLWPRIILTALLAAASTAHGRGASPYLPLSLSPEIERRVERVMILADRPVLTRPIAAAAVLDALPQACERDAELCQEVRRYLNGYMRDAGIAHLGVAVGADSGTPTTLPNRYGMPSDSRYELAASAYWHLGDLLLFNAGVLVYEDENTPVGSVLSFGTEYAQLDVGYRGHWLSPLSDSAMLLGTQAPTMPSITVSNYTPLTRLRLRYQVFRARMSESSKIAFEGGVTSGSPQLAGLHVSIEPVPGWSLGANRLMQYGGGNRSGGLRDFIDALLRPNRYDNTGTDADFGNQAASLTSSFLVPRPLPFAVYFEYAGEDTSSNHDLRLGNVALSGGIRIPSLAGRFDLTVEASEWQNGWYVHHIFQDGLRHERHVIGHWGGDWRVENDGVGGRSLMARVGWQHRSGALLEATYRSLDNASYSGQSYERAHLLEMRYSRVWREQFFVGAELHAGRDVFGESFSRLGAFFRF